MLVHSQRKHDVLASIELDDELVVIAVVVLYKTASEEKAVCVDQTNSL